MKLLLFLFCFTLASAKLVPFHVSPKTDSMAPAMLPGDIVWVEVDAPYGSIKKGDVLIWIHPRLGSICHRAFCQMRWEGRLVWWTKGDNCQLPDTEYCTPENFVGIVRAQRIKGKIIGIPPKGKSYATAAPYTP